MSDAIWIRRLLVDAFREKRLGEIYQAAKIGGTYFANWIAPDDVQDLVEEIWNWRSGEVMLASHEAALRAAKQRAEVAEQSATYLDGECKRLEAALHKAYQAHDAAWAVSNGHSQRADRESARCRAAAELLAALANQYSRSGLEVDNACGPCGGSSVTDDWLCPYHEAEAWLKDQPAVQPEPQADKLALLEQHRAQMAQRITELEAAWATVEKATRDPGYDGHTKAVGALLIMKVAFDSQPTTDDHERQATLADAGGGLEWPGLSGDELGRIMVDDICDFCITHKGVERLIAAARWSLPAREVLRELLVLNENTKPGWSPFDRYEECWWCDEPHGKCSPDCAWQIARAFLTQLADQMKPLPEDKV